MPGNYSNNQGFGLATRPVGNEGQRELLLVDVDQDGEERGRPSLHRQNTMNHPGGHANPYSHLPIYLTIHQ